MATNDRLFLEQVSNIILMIQSVFGLKLNEVTYEEVRLFRTVAKDNKSCSSEVSYAIFDNGLGWLEHMMERNKLSVVSVAS